MCKGLKVMCTLPYINWGGEGGELSDVPSVLVEIYD